MTGECEDGAGCLPGLPDGLNVGWEGPGCQSGKLVLTDTSVIGLTLKFRWLGILTLIGRG